MSLPAADDLFRPSVPAQARRAGSSADAGRRGEPVAAARAAAPEEDPQDAATGSGGRRTSGRVRHDEKMTVYVTAEELIELEHARLTLRRDQGLAVDRGRLVREAVAIALGDLEDRGEDSDLVQRLLSQ